MEQLLLHLLGDYITQTDWMAKRKSTSSFVALIHATTYAIPFLLIGSMWATTVILAIHFVVDRFGIARYVCFIKNWTTEPSLKWSEVKSTGYPKETPIWLSTWLVIIVDNTLHLASNYLILTLL